MKSTTNNNIKFYFEFNYTNFEKVEKLLTKLNPYSYNYKYFFSSLCEAMDTCWQSETSIHTIDYDGFIIEDNKGNRTGYDYYRTKYNYIVIELTEDNTDFIWDGAKKPLKKWKAIPFEDFAKQVKKKIKA
jgi:hypothetical protein